MTRKIGIDQAPAVRGSDYPSPFDEPCRERLRRRLGDLAGLTQFGVNLQNRSTHAATVLEIGTRRLADDEAFYPDIDLHALNGDAGYAHRDGRPYPRR